MRRGSPFDPCQPLPDVAAFAAARGERACTPEATLARVRPYFGELGITRVGLVTGLDRVGVPVGMAVRPNGLSLSVHQGKGLTEAAALTSAAMEAVEVALAERVRCGDFAAAPAKLAGGPEPLVDLHRLTRCRHGRLDPDVAIPLLRGRDLVSGDARLVPAALVAIDHTAPPDATFDRSSDGLASGNTADEAILHGLLELIERDAVALAKALPKAAFARTARPVAAFGSPVLEDLAQKLAGCGLALTLHDVTGAFAIPVVSALVGPSASSKVPEIRRSDVTAGHACHPDPAVAAIRAVTEACQARATAIAGARDDIGLAWYRAADETAPTDATAGSDFVAAAAMPGDPAGRIRSVLDRLHRHGMREVVVVNIPSPVTDIHAVRVLVPGLEIGPGAEGRHVGPRLLAAFLGRQP